jgi:protein-S-isoprenylcysteine O-methyltransferase Ste14
MSLTDWEAAAAVYLPLSAALIVGLLNPHRSRKLAACLLSLLWVIPTLLCVQVINLRAGWWTFSGDALRLRAMPIECFAGWAILWGLIPSLSLPLLGIRRLAVLLVSVDLLAMPLCRPLVLLGPHWLAGECFAAIVVLAPALAVAKWTLDGTNLRMRAASQIAISALVFLYLLPEIAFAIRPGRGWAPLLMLPSWLRQIELQTVLLLAIPGVSAVMEFAERGRGTPFPYDPPTRLVTTGIYRYCANPMQISCAAVMFLWAGMLRNGWLYLAAATSVLYSAGIAEWDERQDLAQRFGGEWKQYRAQVRNWRPRWKPFHSGPDARIYISATCGPCSELRGWLEARDPVGLKIIDAEELAQGSIQRIRYQTVDDDPPVDGVRAMGRALEHLNLGWALAGFSLRIPGIWHAVQLVMDAGGLGPRTLAASARAGDKAPR